MLKQFAVFASLGVALAACTSGTEIPAAEAPHAIADDRSKQPLAPLPTPSKYRWPVKGKIISGFGKDLSGKHNDGINIAAPLGANVAAAEEGIVAYAGNDLKGYGNLVLIRHAGSWVTAYAHLNKMVVQPGERVRQGQVIGQVGKTGTVGEPQLHFELRRNSTPVDPILHLSN